MKQYATRSVMLILFTIAKFALGAGGGTEVFTFEVIAGYEWRYSISDGKATLLSAPQAINGKLDIPECFETYPVVQIAPSAFAGRDDIVRLSMPDTVETIGGEAFSGCTNMTSITMSQSVTGINYCAFYGCSALTEFTIPNSVQSMGTGVFAGCSSLKKLTIPFIGSKRGNNEWNNDYGRFAYIFYRDPYEGAVRVPRIFGINSYDYYLPTNLTEVVVTDETVVSYGAFKGCSCLQKITFLSEITSVNTYAFAHCSQLEEITFFGNKPAFYGDMFYGDGDNTFRTSGVFRVSRHSEGWGVAIPSIWNGFRIEYIEDIALPEASSENEVSNLMETFADVNAAVNVRTVEQYNVFRNWAYAVKLPNGVLGSVQAVKDSPRAWLSFALGADRLVPDVLTSDDIKIKSFAPMAEGGKFTFEVSVANVDIGGGNVEKGTVIANLKKVFEIEGAKKLSPDTFTPDGIEVVFDVPANGNARVVVAPPADADDVYFMRVKVK